MLGKGDKELATRVAGIIFSFLVLVAAALALIGVLAAPLLVSLITPGFVGEKRELTIFLVRILFPWDGVLSVFCLVPWSLNSHRRFFLSYVAPVIWNGAIVVALLLGAGRDQSAIAEYAAWGVLVGSFLQWIVQLPSVVHLYGGVRLSLDYVLAPVRTVFKQFVPVLFGRGVVQLSAFVDNIISSLLPHGALATLAYSQMIYLLPVSLFGMSVSAAELPEMSRAGRGAEELVRARVERAIRQLYVLIVPSAFFLICLGFVVAAALFEAGEFKGDDTQRTWWTLALLSVGLVPATISRLLASAFYSLVDTRTPVRIALVRVVISTFLGYIAAIHGPRFFGLPEMNGLFGLAGAAAFAAWIEFFMLSAKLRVRLQGLDFSRVVLGKVILAAGVATATAAVAFLLVAEWQRFLRAFAVGGTFATCYAAGGLILNIAEIRAILRRTADTLR